MKIGRKKALLGESLIYYMRKIEVLFWRKRLCLQNRTNQNVVDFYENVDNGFEKCSFMKLLISKKSLYANWRKRLK